MNAASPLVHEGVPRRNGNVRHSTDLPHQGTFPNACPGESSHVLESYSVRSWQGGPPNRVSRATFSWPYSAAPDAQARRKCGCSDVQDHRNAERDLDD